MELRRHWFVLVRWWWLVALSTIVAAAVSYAVSRQLTPVYSAASLIMVDQAQNPVTADYNSVLASEQLTRTYGQLLTTEPILTSTIAQLHLDVSAADLATMVKTTVVPNTELIQLAVENTDPAQARDVANTIARVFIEQNRQDKLGKSASSEQVLRQELADVDAQLKQTTAALDNARANGHAQSAETLQIQSLLSQQQSTYSQLIRSLEQVQLDQARVGDQIRVAEPARLPTVPVRPKTLLNVVLAGVVGLLVGLGMAYLIEYLDDTVKTPDDVEKSAGLISLGTIARMPRPRGVTSAVLNEEQSGLPIAEAYRILRTNVDFARVGQPGKVLLVTSASESEGKTTTVANLAIVMAQSGRRAIAVDSDLRRPSLHLAMGVSNENGLTNLLLDDNPDIGGALQPTVWPNLSVLTSGPIPPNPAELLGSDHMEQLLDRLREHADVLLLDSPPCLVVADPSILAARVDGVILVVDAGKTRAEALVRSKERLLRGSAHILGVVLNRLSSRISGYYQYDDDYRYSTQSAKRNGFSTNGHVGSGRGRRPTPSLQRADAARVGAAEPGEATTK